LRYFGTKEDLALEPTRESLRIFKESLATKPKDQSVVDCFRKHIKDYLSNLSEKDEERFDYIKLVRQPPLRPLTLEVHRELEDFMAESLSREAGVDPGKDVYASILATNLVSASCNASDRYLESGDINVVIGKMLAVINLIEANFPPREEFMNGWSWSDDKKKTGRRTRSAGARSAKPEMAG
jgi:hypothetical protein